MDKMNEIHEDSASSIDPKASLDFWQHSLSSPTSDASDLYRSAFEDLLQRRWFRRVWIIQEVASARAAVIVCGWRSISTKTFVRMLSILDTTPHKTIQAVLDVMPGHLRKVSWWSEGRDLHTLIAKFAASEATDPRDKIYALLGILSDACDNTAFLPNYKKPLPEVLRDVARFLALGTILCAPKHILPVLTLTELIQDLGKLRRDIILWTAKNSDPAQWVPQLPDRIKLKPDGTSLFLSDLARWDPHEEDGTIVRLLLHNQPSLDCTKPLEIAI